jgi:hypothetical protein
MSSINCSGVFSAALAIETIEEVSEFLPGSLQSLLKDVTGHEMFGSIYEVLRAAAYTGFIGLLAEHLMINSLKKPDASERKSFRYRAREDSKNLVFEIIKQRLPFIFEEKT